MGKRLVVEMQLIRTPFLLFPVDFHLFSFFYVATLVTILSYTFFNYIFLLVNTPTGLYCLSGLFTTRFGLLALFSCSLLESCDFSVEALVYYNGFTLLRIFIPYRFFIIVIIG